MSHPDRRRGPDVPPLTEGANLYWDTNFNASQVKAILDIENHPLDYWTRHLAEYPTLLSPSLSSTASRGSGTWRAYQLVDMAHLALMGDLHVQPRVDHDFDLSSLVGLLVNPPEGCESWARLAFEAVEEWDDQAPFLFLQDGGIEVVRGWFGVAEFTAKNTSAAYVNMSLLGKDIVERASEVLASPTQI